MGDNSLIELDSELYVKKPDGKLDENTKLEIKALLKKLFNQGILLDSSMAEVTRIHFPGFAIPTINGILKSMIPEINESTSIEAQFKFDGIYKSILAEGIEVAQNGDFEKDTEKMFALVKATEILDKYIGFMERFGIKPKIPDVIKTDSGELSVDKMREIYQKSLEGKKRNDSSE